MKLIYFWSKDCHKANIYGRSRNDFEFNDGFTLLSCYIVEFLFEKGQIYIQKMDSEIECFYGKNINDVIAIVGENGAGKSTVLSMLAEESSHIHYAGREKEYIKIFEEVDGSITVYYYLNRKLKFIGDKKLAVKLINTRYNNHSSHDSEFDLSCIFIANNFEWRDFYGLALFNKNKSDNIIEYNFAKKIVQLSLNPEISYGAELDENKTLVLIKSYEKRMEENIIERVALYQIRLLVMSMRYIPSKLRHELSEIYGSFNVGIKVFSSAFNMWDDEQLKELIKLERNINYRETRYIIYACYQFILLETCYFFEKYVGEMIESHFADNKEEIVDIEFLNCIIEKLKVESIKDELGYDITQLNWYQQLVASLHIFEKYNNERLYIGNYTFASSNGKRFLEFLSDIFSQDNKFFLRILTFKYYPSSTGENALAYIFAYIHDAINYRTKNKDILIFIDEIDSALHPRWQQTILWYLLEYLNSFEDYHFQIVFTTHSPIILSDLTDNRIIRLKRDKNKIKIFTKENQTFGANIMRLYYDDFFMDNGGIGEFVKKKIKQVVDYLNGKDNNISLTEVQYIIDHIGEPTVKRQLKQKLNELVSNKEQTLIELIQEIGVQEAIERLQKRK